VDKESAGSGRLGRHRGRRHRQDLIRITQGWMPKLPDTGNDEIMNAVNPFFHGDWEKRARLIPFSSPHRSALPGGREVIMASEAGAVEPEGER